MTVKTTLASRVYYCFSYAVKDLWESEQHYVKDLEFTLNTYHAKFPTVDLPTKLQGQHERIFGNLPEIKDFHRKYAFTIV